RTILSMLQQNADIPVKVIADAVNLSPSAVERRISKLNFRRTVQPSLELLQRVSMFVLDFELNQNGKRAIKGFRTDQRHDLLDDPI
ncbi:AsnC family transcriptional regulator, partial [Rhizobium ruizarguesonis]